MTKSREFFSSLCCGVWNQQLAAAAAAAGGHLDLFAIAPLQPNAGKLFTKSRNLETLRLTFNFERWLASFFCLCWPLGKEASGCEVREP